MPSYLIVDHSLADSYKYFLLQRSRLSPQSPDPQRDPDTILIQSQPPSSIGIEQVRQIFKSLTQKPSRGLCRFVYLESASHLTQPAQNALLKILEEPPQFAHIFLSTLSEHLLLPTILSRCILIKNNSNKSFTSSQLENQQLIYQQILASPASQRLILAQKFATNRQSAKDFCQSQLAYTHQRLIHANQNYSTTTLIGQLSHALNLLDTNVSPAFILENLFLNYPLSIS